MTELPKLSNPAPLHEYLENISMALKVAEPEPEPPPPPPPPAKTRRWLVGVAAVSVAAGLVVAVRSNGQTPQWLPKHAYGAWGTTNPRYSDRQFWITEKQIAFQTGPTKETVAIYPLRAVRNRKGGADTTYIDIDYGQGETVMTLSTALIERPKPALLFLSQKGLKWTPAVGGTWPSGLTVPSRILDFGK